MQPRLVAEHELQQDVDCCRSSDIRLLVATYNNLSVTVRQSCARIRIKSGGWIVGSSSCWAPDADMPKRINVLFASEHLSGYVEKSLEALLEEVPRMPHKFRCFRSLPDFWTSFFL